MDSLPDAFPESWALKAAGLFRDALERLPRSAPPTRKDRERQSYDVLRSELLLELGLIDEALEVAGALSTRDDSPFECRILLVQAKGHFLRGDFDLTTRLLQRASSVVKSSGLTALRAQVELVAFGVTSTTQPLEAAGSAITDLKRLIAHTGDPHLMVELRLAVARAEARCDSPSVAKRHLEVARSLLDGYPNEWLSGMLHLDMSIVAALRGENLSSLENARAALSSSERSGHFRTRVGALINIAHLLTRVGDFSNAKRHAETAISLCVHHPQLELAALDSKADLLITQGDYAGAGTVFERIERISGELGERRLHWDKLSEIHSRARLLIGRGEWSTAAEELSDGITKAEKWRDKGWYQRMQLTRVRCLGFVASAPGDHSLGLPPSHSMRTAEECAQRSGAIAALKRATEPYQSLGRAVRIAENLGSRTLLYDVTVGFTIAERETAAVTLPPPDLESAVALFDVAAHPYVLAKEALAIAQGAGCVRAAALVVRKDGALRVLESHGWDERDALQAARKAGPSHLIECGVQRDESLLVVAEPCDDLDRVSTWMAIRTLVSTAVTLDHYRRDEKQRAALWPAESLDGDPDCIWVSEQISDVLRVAQRIGPTTISVLLTGETGTGKEMMARAIHRASGRADRPLLAFNCTAVPRDMLESQLFGYRKGAFTGAESSFTGIIRAAEGGTLFLDEIADMPLDLQPKLLRFLETHEIHPFGEPHPIKVDVRVIAATNVNLDQLVAEGRFREDLFYRLNVVRLRLPPLRERREEIPALVEHYIRRYGEQLKKGHLALSDEALEYLLLYSWPGNLRQLANEVNRMVALAEPNSALIAAQLSPEILAARKTLPASTAPDSELRVSLDQSLPDAVDRLERLMVQAALDRCHGRLEEAARLLGISRKGLFLKRRRWGITES